MIRTQDCIEFMDVYLPDKDLMALEKETKDEIVARLRAYDKLKESIEKLIATMSSGVDK